MEGSSLHIVCPHCGAINRVPASRPTGRAKCGSCHLALFEGKSVRRCLVDLLARESKDELADADAWLARLGVART